MLDLLQSDAPTSSQWSTLACRVVTYLIPVVPGRCHGYRVAVNTDRFAAHEIRNIRRRQGKRVRNTEHLVMEGHLWIMVAWLDEYSITILKMGVYYDVSPSSHIIRYCKSVSRIIVSLTSTR